MNPHPERREIKAMTFQEACDKLNFNASRDIETLKRMAGNRLNAMTLKAPLKEKVACKVILSA